jgi:hypothetical protein
MNVKMVCNFTNKVYGNGFNSPFINATVISWRSVLLVEETGVHGENHRPVVSH